jgi:Fic family protein
VEGKPFKDFLDAKNHAEAIDFLFDVVKQNRPITESLIKELNALLMSGLDFTPAIEASGNTVRKPAHPGAYKQQSNHVLQPDGTIHRYVEPLQVQPEMEALCDYIRISPDHVIHVAAMAHYHLVRIHPFDDGNGRVARILMNLILLRAAYSPAVIRIETRRQYLLALSQADQGNTEEFVRFVVEAVRVTQESILSDLKR